MMKYVEDYSVSAVIVKDLSRLGGEYSYMDRLQNFIFPAYDVRFVVKMRGEVGEHIASNSPYGYIKKP